MARMVGADADELERAASQLRSAASELDQYSTGLSSLLGSVEWLGFVAGSFLSSWSGVHRMRMHSTGDFIRDAAETLERNARAQRRTSADNGGGGPRGPFQGIRYIMDQAAELGRRFAAEAARKRQLAAALQDDLAAMSGASPAEQLAWWNSLSDEQRAALIWLESGALLGLDGLPPDVIDAAQKQFQSDMADEIVTSRSKASGTVSFDVKLVKVEAGISYERTDYADGSVTLTFGAHVGAGGDIELAEAMARAGIDGTYRFDSAAEAQAFIDGFIDALPPDNAWEYHNVVGNAMNDAIEYLRANDHHLESVAVEGGVGVEVSDPTGNSASVEVTGRVERNVQTGEFTVSATGAVDAKVDLVPIGMGPGVRGHGSASVAMTMDGSTPQSLTISFDYQGEALVVDNLGVAHAATGTVSAGTTTMTFDLTDPGVRAALGDVVAAAARGDVGATMAGAAAAGDMATVVVQQHVGTTSEAGFDAVVVEGKVKTQSTTATSTYIKPPGGQMFLAEK